MEVDASLDGIKAFAKQQKQKNAGQASKPRKQSVVTTLVESPSKRRQVEDPIKRIDESIEWGAMAEQLPPAHPVPQELQGRQGLQVVPPMPVETILSTAEVRQPGGHQGNADVQGLDENDEEYIVLQKLNAIRAAKQAAKAAVTPVPAKRQPRTRCQCSNSCTMADCMYFDRVGYQPMREANEKLTLSLLTKDPRVDKILQQKMEGLFDRMLSKITIDDIRNR